MRYGPLAPLFGVCREQSQYITYFCLSMNKLALPPESEGLLVAGTRAHTGSWLRSPSEPRGFVSAGKYSQPPQNRDRKSMEDCCKMSMVWICLSQIQRLTYSICSYLFYIYLLNSTKEDMKMPLMCTDWNKWKNSWMIKNNFLTSSLVKPCARIDYCRFLWTWKESFKKWPVFISLGILICTLRTVLNQVQVGLK